MMPDTAIHRQSWVEPREDASRPKGERFFVSLRGGWKHGI
jgi:hypothetical protein